MRKTLARQNRKEREWFERRDELQRFIRAQRPAVCMIFAQGFFAPSLVFAHIQRDNSFAHLRAP